MWRFDYSLSTTKNHGVVGLVFSTRFQSHITCNRFKSRMPKRRFQCSSVIEKQSKMSAAEGFVQFLRKTPTQFHVVRECVKQLTAAGFTRISEKESWEGKVKPSGPLLLHPQRDVAVRVRRRRQL